VHARTRRCVAEGLDFLFDRHIARSHAAGSPFGSSVTNEEWGFFTMHKTKRSHDGGGSTRSLKRVFFLMSLIVGLAAVSATAASVAKADSVGPITFEPSQGYVPGDINGQQGWMKLGPYDAMVASLAAFPAASGYGFGTQALRFSDAVTSGSFGDQTFSPGLLSPAGEFPAKSQFDATFRIGTTQSTLQSGLHLSVSPDDGNGGRMSYLRFEDQADGVHVFFDDVTDPGPLGTVASFDEVDIATLSRTRAHSIRFSIQFKTGPGNDVVKIYIDGNQEITGTTWEDYYRYDPEQTGNGNQVPTTSKLLFRESGTADVLNAGNGFVVDGVTLASSNNNNDDHDGHGNHGNDHGDHGDHDHGDHGDRDGHHHHHSRHGGN
jgi:hypothetical protein